MSEARHRDDLATWQRLLQPQLGLGRNGPAAATDDVEHWTPDLADLLPELGGDEAFHQIGVALPDETPIRLPPGSKTGVRAQKRLGRAPVLHDELHHELVF